MNSDAPTPDPERVEAAAEGPTGTPETERTEPTPQLSPDEQIAALEARNAELNDAYLRARAEVENTRRRSEEEMAKVRKFAVEAFAESLLPVRDSLEAAVAIPNASNEQLLEGVHATLRQLSQAMERHKMLQLNPEVGSKFDPLQQQAISMVPADQEPNTVVSVLQRGYVIAERVLRPALVTVSAPPQT